MFCHQTLMNRGSIFVKFIINIFVLIFYSINLLIYGIVKSLIHKSFLVIDLTFPFRILNEEKLKASLVENLKSLDK